MILENNKACPVTFANRTANGRRMKTNNEPSFTIDTSGQQGLYDGKRVRKLTPVECERLQGFPDNWTSILSDTQRYKTIGNAVPTPVIKLIAEKLE